MEITRERISFDPRDMLLSLLMGFSFVRAEVACAGSVNSLNTEFHGSVALAPWSDSERFSIPLYSIRYLYFIRLNKCLRVFLPTLNMMIVIVQPPYLTGRIYC